MVDKTKQVAINMSHDDHDAPRSDGVLGAAGGGDKDVRSRRGSEEKGLGNDIDFYVENPTALDHLITAKTVNFEGRHADS